MPTLQYKFEFATSTMLRLSEVEEILKQQRIFQTPPSRKTLIEMCEDGTLDAQKTRFGWVVSEGSFDDWVRSCMPQKLAA